MQMERQRLRDHAQGKMARALGYALPGESREEMDRIASEDQRLAQSGMVQLKSGQRIYYKHIEELTREDRADRIAAERETVEWLKERVERWKRGAEAPHTRTSTRNFLENADCGRSSSQNRTYAHSRG
jgi:hypothetical protein